MKQAAVLIGFCVGVCWGNVSSANICEDHCGVSVIDNNTDAALCWCDGICHEQDPPDCCQDDAGTKGGDRTYVDAACGEGAVCGDGTCEATESSLNCPADCGGPAGSCVGHCGVAVPIGKQNWCYCDAGCTESNDCCPDFSSACLKEIAVVPVCGNGACEGGEDGTSCPEDCVSLQAVCGDGTCQKWDGESFENCPADCPPPEGPRPPIGGACSELQDCVSPAACATGVMYCTTPDSCTTFEMPGGYCAVPTCEANSCPDGAGCFSLSQPGSGDNPDRLCLATCEEDDDCRTGEGYACRTGVCIPTAGNWATLELVRLDKEITKEITDDKKNEGDGGGSGGCSLLR